MTWTPWKPLPVFPRFDPVSLTETLDGGQAFRWDRDESGVWTGQWSDQIARIKLVDTENLKWSTPADLETTTTEDQILSYLGAKTDWHERIDHLPWRSDPHLRKTIDAFPGLRILDQPIEDALLGFLCSATKQILQIKQMVYLMARNLGQEMVPGIWRLPTFDEIARHDLSDLKACLLGFRAKYILETARFLAENPGWLNETETRPYPEARTRLMQLPGVGGKIADCVLLFGAGKLEAFPVDTWIAQALARRYSLTNWSNDQLTQFGRAHFGPSAGLAQQFLFSWERRQ